MRAFYFDAKGNFWVKWIALAIGLAAIMPLSGWLRRNPRETPKVWMLMGFMPFGMSAFHLYMAVISWAGWPGHVQGAEISYLDLLAIALYLSLPRNEHKVPFRLSMALYFIAVVASAIQASVSEAALFYAWQLARMFLIFAVVTKASADERVPRAILTGMAIGLCFEACETVWERFGLGILQATGTMGHQNFLGLLSHFVTFPWFSLLLAGERGWLPIVVPIAGVVVAVLTVSRATIGLEAIGYVSLFGLSAIRRWTARKARVMAVGVVAIALMVPLVASSLTTRFDEQKSSGGYDERAAFIHAATMMISDHPFGVGANNYVVVANTGGYNNRAEVAAVLGSDSANVHNIYYLVTAETGYIGLLTFILMLMQPLVVAFRCGWNSRGDTRGDLLLGLGMSLFIVYIHAYFEWIFITFTAQYMLALEIGMVAGLANQLGYWRTFRVSYPMRTNSPIAHTTSAARSQMQP